MNKKCSFCGNQTGEKDHDAMVDSAGIYCGKCCHRLGFKSYDIIPECDRCQLPIMGELHHIGSCCLCTQCMAKIKKRMSTCDLCGVFITPPHDGCEIEGDPGVCCKSCYEYIKLFDG